LHDIINDPLKTKNTDTKKSFCTFAAAGFKNNKTKAD